MDNHPGLELLSGKPVFSESSVQKILLKHIKPATEQHRGMYRCTICVIFKAMYEHLHLWRLKQIRRMEDEIRKIDGSTRSKTVLKLSLTRYSKSIVKDERQHPEQAWTFSGMAACPKVEVKEEGQEKGRCFHKFSCVMGLTILSIQSVCRKVIR